MLQICAQFLKCVLQILHGRDFFKESKWTNKKKIIHVWLQERETSQAKDREESADSRLTQLQAVIGDMEQRLVAASNEYISTSSRIFRSN